MNCSNYDNALNTRVQIYRNQVGIDATLSPVLSFRGNVGAPIWHRWRCLSSHSAALCLHTQFQVRCSIGSATLSYLSNAEEHDVVRSSPANRLDRASWVRCSNGISMWLALSHSINSRSTLSFSASGNRQISTTTTDFASASATYSYNFTRELARSAHLPLSASVREHRVPPFSIQSPARQPFPAPGPRTSTA